MYIFQQIILFKIVSQILGMMRIKDTVQGTGEVWTVTASGLLCHYLIADQKKQIVLQLLSEIKLVIYFKQGG